MAEILFEMDLLLLEQAEEEIRQAAKRRGRSLGEGAEPEVKTERESPMSLWLESRELHHPWRRVCRSELSKDGSLGNGEAGNREGRGTQDGDWEGAARRWAEEEVEPTEVKQEGSSIPKEQMN